MFGIPQLRGRPDRPSTGQSGLVRGEASFHAGGERLLFYGVQMALRLSSRSRLV